MVIFNIIAYDGLIKPRDTGDHATFYVSLTAHALAWASQVLEERGSAEPGKQRARSVGHIHCLTLRYLATLCYAKCVNTAMFAVFDTS